MSSSGHTQKINQITHAGVPSPFWLVRAHFAWLVMNVKIFIYLLGISALETGSVKDGAGAAPVPLLLL